MYTTLELLSKAKLISYDKSGLKGPEILKKANVSIMHDTALSYMP